MRMMSQKLRKLALTAHIGVSVSLLGAIGCFFALAVDGLTGGETQIHIAYPAMDLTARYVIVPLAFAAIVTGIVEALGTRWGLFRYYWVTAKLALTIFATAVLLVKMSMIAAAADAAATATFGADFGRTQVQLVAHSLGGFVVLFVPLVLSVYKPGGMTPFAAPAR